MCIKMGNNELSSVKSLMTMSLNAIIADIFDMDLEEIQRGLRLKEDMAMDEVLRDQLAERIAEYFDGLRLDFSAVKTVDDLFAIVVDQAFADVPA